MSLSISSLSLLNLSNFSRMFKGLDEESEVLDMARGDLEPLLLEMGLHEMDLRRLFGLRETRRPLWPCRLSGERRLSGDREGLNSRLLSTSLPNKSTCRVKDVRRLRGDRFGGGDNDNGESELETGVVSRRTSLRGILPIGQWI